VLWLQRQAGNTAVAASVDNEGNELGTSGGRPYITRLNSANYPHLGNPLPAAVPLNPAATYNSLRAQCVAVRDEQLATANSLRGDMKYWFAKVYHFVTRNILDAAAAGTFAYPMAVFQEVLAFHATYARNLDEWRAGHIANVEHNWRVAFREAEDVNDGSWYRTRAQEILSALLPSMQAHIRFDLPRAIASVYERNYDGLPGVSMPLFHADYERMGPVFDRANANLQPEIDAECYGIDPGSWQWTQDLGFPFIFHIALEREHAWEKATTIESGHDRGINDQRRMQERMEAYQTAAHPMRGGDDFAISTSWGSGYATQEAVTDYDWNTQP
jgi:hypothetical protein